jgi:hypothetical protein
MKKALSFIALWVCFTSAFGQTAVPDTVYIYETVTVYDTIVIRDTVRIRKAPVMPAVQPKNIGADYFASPTEKRLSPAATFSENRIIVHESNSYQKQKEVKIMNLKALNYLSYLSAVILTAQSMAGLSAQETQPAEELESFPMQIGIVYPMTSQGNQTVNYRYHLSFNMLSGKVGAVTGIEFGGLFNQVKHDLSGVQFGGLANRTHDMTGVQFGGLGNAANTVTGIQFGGLANISKDVTGVQFAGWANIAENVRGIQYGGIVNIAKEVTGIRFGGIVNMSEQTKGAQFAGIVNLSEKSEGAQFAGIANISREVSGASFGGVVNRTGTLRGVQFGLVNVIDTIENGISIALVNIVKKNFYDEWSLASADYLNVGLTYKMGIQKFYTILTAGANFMEDRLWAYGIGFGNRTALNRRFDFQPEVVSYRYFPDDFKNVRNTTATHLKFGFVYKLNEKLGITVAPSVYHFNSDLDDSGQIYKVSPIKEFLSKKYDSNRHFHSFGMGISVGLVLR